MNPGDADRYQEELKDGIVHMRYNFPEAEADIRVSCQEKDRGKFLSILLSHVRYLEKCLASTRSEGK